MKKQIKIFTVLFMTFINVMIFAQSHEMYLQAPTEATYINKIIMGDTLTDGSRTDLERVYVLQRGGVWFFNGVIKNIGWDVKIKAEDGEGPIPIIYGTVEEGGSNIPVNFIEAQGNVFLKNIVVNGIFDLDPDYKSFTYGAPRELITYTVAGDYTLNVKGCIFENAYQANLRTASGIRSIIITDCIFANSGCAPWQSISNGRALDIRNVSCDTVKMVNNSFINTNDRVFRHIASTARLNNFIFEHNTIVTNGGRYGTLALGLIGDNVKIKNNLFIDPMTFGADTSSKRQSDFKENGESFSDQIVDKVNMTLIYSQHEDTAYATNFDIQNNYWHFTSEILNTWEQIRTVANNPSLKIPDPMTRYITVNVNEQAAFVYLNDMVDFNNVPAPMAGMVYWNLSPGPEGAGESSSGGTAFQDFDRRTTIYHRDTLDCGYPTSSTLYTASTDGLPIGDLNWFPDKKAEWENPTPPLIIVDGEKDAFFDGLTGPDDGYLQLRSFAHSDNGAPTDDADLSVKLWSAWDDDWFYIYEEVIDDQVSGDAANVWEEDEIELKFDPQPTDSTVNSNWETRLTALGQGEGDAVQFDNLGPLAAENKQYFRKLTANGYVLEMAIKWTGIVSGTGSEKITPAVDNIFGFAINQHDNDETKARVASLTWAAKLLDALWNTPKYLGTAKFLAGNKLQYIPTNNMTGKTNTVPYDGSDLVGVDDVNLLPTEFAVSQNYPNPFNPTTMINYALPKKANVKLVVFNTIGQQVATLVNQEMIAGYHSVNYDASKLSSGIYFYTLSAGDFISTQKMILLK